MKEQTALQELIEWMDTNKSHCTYGTIRGKATELLTKEREQITDAFMAGESNQGSHYPSFYEAESYFTTTYKQPL